MTAPLASLFHGDITIETGCDTSLYGLGNLSVATNVTIFGTANGTGSSDGALSIPNGGLSVGVDSYLAGELTVNSTSNLQTTFIDTTQGVFNVSGGNAANIQVNGNATLISNTGNTTVSASTGNTIISSGDNASNAIQITATNNAGGGVTVLSGQSGGLTLTGGSGGIQEVTSAGNIALTANNASGSFVVNSSAGNQNLTLAQYGVGQASGVLITADGSGANGNSSVEILSQNTGGSITLSNNTSGSGSINNYTGSGGFYATTVPGGPIGLTSNAANSYFLVNASGGSGQTLTVGVSGGSYSGNQLILQSNGSNPTQAILITTTNTAGGIMLNQPTGSQGGVVIDTGSNGLTATTQVGGGINLTANGGVSSFINHTTSDNQNLTLCVNGTTASSLILCSEGTGLQAIQINSTGISGGIFATAVGSVNINTSDSANGINIGTLTSVPVKIGMNNSTTTIYGNLDIRGVTTTVESTTVQITDNIIELNNGPTGTADGGIAIKRYQPANNNCIGDVVADTADYHGSVVSATDTSITLSILEGSSGGIPAPIPDFTGWWIKITSGTGQCECRRIKGPIGGGVATLDIYTTADQTNILNNPIPPEGLNWSATDANSNTGAIPDATSTYALFPCEWIISMWDSQNKNYALVCSPMTTMTSMPPIAHYVDLQINNLIANHITANSINGVAADLQITFSLSDNSSALIELNHTIGTTFPNPYGIYIVMIRPTTALTTRTSAIFLIGSIGGIACGQVVRIISVKGNANDQLDMSWPASGGSFTGYPCIQYRPAPGTSTTTSYTGKIISV